MCVPLFVARIGSVGVDLDDGGRLDAVAHRCGRRRSRTGSNAGRLSGPPVRRSKAEPCSQHSMAQPSTSPSASDTSAWEQRSLIAKTPSSARTTAMAVPSTTTRLAAFGATSDEQADLAGSRSRAALQPARDRPPARGPCRGAARCAGGRPRATRRSGSARARRRRTRAPRAGARRARGCRAPAGRTAARRRSDRWRWRDPRSRRRPSPAPGWARSRRAGRRRGGGCGSSRRCRCRSPCGARARRRSRRCASPRP